MTPDSEGLHEIANTTDRDRKGDIVFVHGLGGASHRTWRHGKEGKAGHFFWPEELGKDLPDCGIWTVGYPAGLTALGKPGMIIEKRAGNLSQKLANAGLGARPLLFITHSMGGLVVKSLIVGSQTLADLDRKRIVSVIRGIVFCATPHRGSAFADAAGVLGEFFGGSQDHVDEMRANAEPLDILHDQFIEWHRNHPIPVDSYAENIGLFRTRWWRRPLPLALVVPRASANPGIAGHSVHDVDEDHLTIVTPRDRKHDIYGGVLRFVRDALTEVPARRVDVPLKATPVSEALAASLCLAKQYPFETLYRALDAPVFPQLLYAAAFWSLLVNISAVTLDSRMSPVIEGLSQDLNQAREALIGAWLEALKGAIEMSFLDWHKQWTQATKHARRNQSTRSKQAEVLARATNTKNLMLSNVAHDTFVTYLDTATDTLAVFTSSAERLKSDEYGTLPSRNYFLALVQQHIPEGPASLKEHFQKNLPTAIGRNLSHQLRDPKGLSGPLQDLNAVMSKTVAQMRGTAAKPAPAIEHELSKALAEVMAHRVELLLTNCAARLGALIESHAAAQQRLWELQSSTFPQDRATVLPNGNSAMALPTLASILEQLGFRSLRSILWKDSPFDRESTPWPVSPAHPWPTWHDLAAGMVTRSLAVDRVISKLRIEQFCLLKGPPASGKSTAAKYIGYLLAKSNPPWCVYILDPRWEAAAKLYDSLDTTRLIVTLAALEYTHQRILLMFDDVHEAPRIILDLYRLTIEHPLPPNIKLLFIGNLSLFTELSEAHAGRQVNQFFLEGPQEIRMEMRMQDIEAAARHANRYKSGNPNAEIPAGGHYLKSFESIMQFCNGNWLLLRAFLQTQKYREMYRFLWAPQWYQSHVDRAKVLLKLKELTLDELSAEEQKALSTVCALSRFNIAARREFFEQCRLIGAVNQLAGSRSLVTMSPDGKAYKVEHPLTGELYLEAFFVRGWRREAHVRLREYLYSKPVNYTEVLSMPRLCGNIVALRKALLGERGEARELTTTCLEKILDAEQDPNLEVQALYNIHRADRQIAHTLSRTSEIMPKIRRSLADMSFTGIVAVARYLRPVYRQKARDMIEELVDKEDVVRQLAGFDTWGEIAPFLRQLGQLYAFHPSLARAISDAARASDVYSKLARLLPNASLEQLATCLKGLAEVDYSAARRLLESLAATAIDRLVCLEEDIRKIARSLNALASVHPQYTTNLASHWFAEGQGHIPFILLERLDIARLSAERVCEIVVHFANVDGSLGAFLASRLSLQDIMAFWKDGGKRLDELEKIVRQLGLANQVSAAMFAQTIDLDDLTASFANSFDFPSHIGSCLRNLYYVNRSIAQRGLTEVMSNRERLTESLELWLRNLELGAVGIFLYGFALTYEPNLVPETWPNTEGDPLYDLLGQCQNIFVGSLSHALQEGMLEEASAFFSRIANHPSLKRFGQQLLPKLNSDLSSAIRENQNNLESLLLLFLGIRQVDPQVIMDVLVSNRGIMVRKLRNRIHRSRIHRSIEVNLTELGDYFSVVKTDLVLAKLSLQELDWDDIFIEARNEGRIGRISVFLNGLAQANFTPDEELRDRLASDFLDILARGVEAEYEVSKISEVIRSLTSIVPEIGTKLVKRIDLKSLCDKIELETRIDCIADILQVYTEANLSQAALLAYALELAALASKIYRFGKLSDTNELVLRLSHAVPEVGTEASETPVAVLLRTHIDFAKLAIQVEKARDAGVIAVLFWNLASLVPLQGRAVLKFVSSEQMAKRICGIRDLPSLPNISGVTQQEMMERVASQKGIAKLSSLLLAARRLDRAWPASLLLNLKCLHADLIGGMGSQLGSDFIKELCYHGEVCQLAWFVREAAECAMDSAGVLANRVTDKLIKTVYEGEHIRLKEIGLALWFIARSPDMKEVARSAAAKIVDKIGVEVVIEGALHGGSLLNVGAALQLGGLVIGCFEEEFWGKFYEEVWVHSTAKQDRDWLVQTLTAVNPTKVKEWRSEMCTTSTDESVWSFGWRLFKFGWVKEGRTFY